MSDEAGSSGSGRGHGVDAHGGVEVGRRVRLPGGAERPIQVFINGVEQKQGLDYEIRSGEIVFNEPIVKEGSLGIARWLAMWAGLFGSYKRNEAVDVHFRRAGRTEVLADAEILSD